jgi:hypothetical protein
MTFAIKSGRARDCISLLWAARSDGLAFCRLPAPVGVGSDLRRGSGERQRYRKPVRFDTTVSTTLPEVFTSCISQVEILQGVLVRRILRQLRCFIRYRFQRRRPDDGNRPPATPDRAVG